MNGDNVSEVSSSSTCSTISSTLCNGCENIKDGYNKNDCSLSIYHQIATARNELISVQRSLIRELLKGSKEFQEKSGNDSYINDQEIEGAEYNIMQTDTESIREEICFIKNIKDLIKGSIEEGEYNVEFEDESFTKNEENISLIEGIGSPCSSDSLQNNHSSSVNEYLMDRSDSISSGYNNENMQTKFTSLPKNNEYLGRYEGFNSVYLGIGNTAIDIRQLKKCLEESFGGHVRFIRIIRDKGCAFAEFKEEHSFKYALESGCVTLNGIYIKVKKTFRKKNLENLANGKQPRAIY